MRRAHAQHQHRRRSESRTGARVRPPSCGSGLVRRKTWATIEELVADGTTALLSTHYIAEAQQLADRLFVLDRGRLIAEATPDALRGRALRTTVRLPLAPGAPTSDLPCDLAAHVEPQRDELLIRTTNVTSVLQRLLDWATVNGADLSGLELERADLEDAYLALTGPPREAEPAHV